MKKKFALATVTAVTTLLFFVGCGVRVTNISVPDVATLEKGESMRKMGTVPKLRS